MLQGVDRVFWRWYRSLVKACWPSKNRLWSSNGSAGASDVLASLTRVSFVPNHRRACGKSSTWLHFSRKGKSITSWCFEDVGLPVYCLLLRGRSQKTVRGLFLLGRSNMQGHCSLPRERGHMCSGSEKEQTACNSNPCPAPYICLLTIRPAVSVCPCHGGPFLDSLRQTVAV